LLALWQCPCLGCCVFGGTRVGPRQTPSHGMPLGGSWAAPAGAGSPGVPLPCAGRLVCTTSRALPDGRCPGCTEEGGGGMAGAGASGASRWVCGSACCVSGLTQLRHAGVGARAPRLPGSRGLHWVGTPAAVPLQSSGSTSPVSASVWLWFRKLKPKELWLKIRGTRQQYICKLKGDVSLRSSRKPLARLRGWRAGR